ncbi:hypothetical protein Poli38472_006244 [Pythium oligandrum]|uniref:Uncharacterized protein n=1 Tax=Pythium oligandrum TaxID=41045 RepID=A0A8K1FMY1_PYTOL|nr:hypothetical protein Poli38472_006244 [Pythium oligandrum]|eukprot:TMW68776.1 hypothetical protein Poli38472_006244 [Pythium oligandrum]
MAVMATKAELEQLWTLACLLSNQQLPHQALPCLEVCVAAGETSQPPTAFVIRAHVLLAETCLTLCRLESKEQSRELWWKRYKRAETSIYVVEKALESKTHPPKVEQEWVVRLYQSKVLLVQQTSKIEQPVQNRQVLENVCAAIRACGEDPPAASPLARLKEQLCAQLRATLADMHLQSMLRSSNQDFEGLAAFDDNLRVVRTAVPSHIDPDFQLWLVMVSCHVLVTSLRHRAPTEVTKAIGFADQWIASQPNLGPDLQLYHMIAKCLSFLRSGEFKKLGPVVEQIKAFRASVEIPTDSPSYVQAAFVDNIIDGLELEVISRYDPSQAMGLSMKAIHLVQTNLVKYESQPDIHLLLLGTLFDMLYIHCNLHLQHSRYFEMAVSVVQMLKLFNAYNHHLEPTIFHVQYSVQIHVLVAKYAIAIGRFKEGESHLNYIVQHLLPPISEDGRAYPRAFIHLWIDLLEASSYCSGVADPMFSIRSNDANGIQMRRIFPSTMQLTFLGKILENHGLKELVYKDGNVELRAKYDLAVCMWLWATQELGLFAATLQNLPRGHKIFPIHEKLEESRPDMLRMLHESLQLVSTHVDCAETTAEIMALFGPKLIEAGRIENGEETLKSAIRLSLHAKNALLQTRLLVDIFHLYTHRQLVQAQATTAEKYEKKIAALQRRIAQAQSENATNERIFKWTDVKAK